MKYSVQANPKGGTCRQIVEANSPEEAIEKAMKNPDGWRQANVNGVDSWNIRAYPRESYR